MTTFLLLLVDVQTFLLGVLVGMMISGFMRTSEKRKELKEVRNIIDAMSKFNIDENTPVKSPLQLKKRE